MITKFIRHILSKENNNSTALADKASYRSILKSTCSASSLAITLAISTSTQALGNSMPTNALVSFEQMKQDVTILANDKAKGRANFSPEIDQAGDYIAQRFTDIGLDQFGNLKNFKQSFSIFQVTPTSLSVTLNGKVLADAQIAFTNAQASFNWQLNQAKQTNHSVNLHVIEAEDDLREALGQVNQRGGQHVMLINKAHQPLFNRYKKYFASGLVKNELNNKHALVLILTDSKAPVSLSVKASAEIKQQQLTNIVGILPGSETPEEIVLYSGHYDHLGINEESGAIYNGADDDASGTTAVINLAEHFAKQKNNKRTLIFTAFTAEEIGGFGSKYFSKQLNPDDVIAMVNIEMIGKPSKFGAGEVWMTGMERSNLGTLLNKALENSKGKVHNDPYPEQRLFYRSDNATLARLGVPAHSFSSTQIDKDQHYHKTTDDIHSLDLKSMHQVINALAIATKGLVNGSITPTRVDINKVKQTGKIY